MIHAIILTLNEEQHIGRCIQSLGGQCASVTVIDSGSTDATTEIAKWAGAEVLVNTFVTHAGQVNFAIDALADRRGWLFRIDADEVLDSDGAQDVAEAVAAAAPDVDGLLVRRRIHFMGRRIQHGGIEPSWQLRLWRNGRGRCEQRWMDEHIKVAGRVAKSELVLSDINLNSLTWWTAKHNSYASREAIDLFNLRHRFWAADELTTANASPQARARRYLKENLYARLPAGTRALAYFIYRYLLRLGFLDGKAGLYFHLMQGLWYRALVDAKVEEIEAYARATGVPIVEAIRDRTGMAVESLSLEPAGAIDRQAGAENRKK